MSNTLIILGAGASYDYKAEKEIGEGKLAFRPPLADKIFRPDFESTINRFPEIRGLSSEIDSSLKLGIGLEDRLLSIKRNDAAENPYFQKQLNAFPFYLQELFGIITHNFGGSSVNNYLKLKNLIKRYQPNDETYVINFNYDLLFEAEFGIGQSRATPSATTIEEYIRNNENIRIIKIHGAYNWKRIFPFPIGNSETNPYKVLMNDPYWLTRHPEVRNPDVFITEVPTVGAYPLYPAIAIPISDKDDHICPQGHIKRLEDNFSKIDRILIIGWKAADDFLLDIFKKYIGNKPIIIVSPEAAQAKARIIQKCGIRDSFRIGTLKTTFSEFMATDVCERVFSTDNPDQLIQSGLFETS